MASFAAEQNPGRSCERYTPANRFHPEMWYSSAISVSFGSMLPRLSSMFEYTTGSAMRNVTSTERFR